MRMMCARWWDQGCPDRPSASEHTVYGSPACPNRTDFLIFKTPSAAPQCRTQLHDRHVGASQDPCGVRTVPQVRRIAFLRGLGCLECQQGFARRVRQFAEQAVNEPTSPPLCSDV
jgi:hypothetical protein